MLTANDFGEVKKTDEDLDNFIVKNIYPPFQKGEIKSEVYFNLIEQDNFTVKAVKDRLKELHFKVSSGDINGDSVLIVNKN